MDFIKEVRITVVVKNEIFQNQATQYHTDKMNNKRFKV